MFSSVENERRVGFVINWFIPRVDIQFINTSSIPLCFAL